MKRLIISGIISVILALGTFLLIFFLMNGWEKIKDERCVVATVAATISMIVIIVAIFIVAIVAFNIFITTFLETALVAIGAVISSVVILTGSYVLITTIIFSSIVVAAIVTAVSPPSIADDNKFKIGTPKKIIWFFLIWFSLFVEGIAISIPIILIIYS
ncbi:hypothetical protein KKA23_02185 [Patescibacteria group bacterium]|nr:hypothetical protein [Patescibacteria group bacterium]MBU3922796.1 hypothetical protein [Patescibacteria group bacterium]